MFFFASILNYGLFQKKFNKSYESPEAEEIAMENLFENNAVIDQHNEQYKKGKVSFGCGINQNADQKPKDINDKINKLDPNMIVPNSCPDKSSDSESSSNHLNRKHRRGKRDVTERRSTKSTTMTTKSTRSTLPTKPSIPSSKDWRYTLSDPRDQGDDCGR